MPSAIPTASRIAHAPRTQPGMSFSRADNPLALLCGILSHQQPIRAADRRDRHAEHHEPLGKLPQVVDQRQIGGRGGMQELSMQVDEAEPEQHDRIQHVADVPQELAAELAGDPQQDERLNRPTDGDPLAREEQRHRHRQEERRQAR